MNEESIGISLDLVSRMDDFITSSLKTRKVERKSVIDFRHFPHHFVFCFFKVHQWKHYHC